jgi:hypothetical protein
MPVDLGNDGHAISHLGNLWTYIHYDKCVPAAPAKLTKKRKKATK